MDLVLGQKLPRRHTLKRGDVELAFYVTADNKIYEAITKIAFTIEKENSLWVAHGGD